MKIPLAALCALFFTSSLAYKLPQGESSLEAESDGHFNQIAQEAILVARILCDVERDLARDEQLDDKMDEYFIRALWKKMTDSVGNAIKKAFKPVGKHIEDYMKGIAAIGMYPIRAAEKTLGKPFSFADQKSVEDKATKVLGKIFDNAVARYSLEDSENGTDFVRYVRTRVEAAWRRLLVQENKLRSL